MLYISVFKMGIREEFMTFYFKQLFFIWKRLLYDEFVKL